MSRLLGVLAKRLFAAQAQPVNASVNKIGPIRRIKSSNIQEINLEPSKDVFPSTVKSVVKAVCTAEAYDFPRLRQHLETYHKLSPFISDDVIHCQVNNGSASDVFIFQNGSFVVWPASNNDPTEPISDILSQFEIGPTASREFEELQVVVEPCKEPHFERETVVLPLRSNNMLMTKLAFSNGLADSVKLATLESYLQDYIAKVKHIPSALQRLGRIDLTRAQVLKLIGELLHFRALLNLQSELIDTPELYWSEPALENLYLRTSRILETRTRINVLNKRLDYANDMAQFLRSHLSEQHGLKLEWGIIILIAVEVAFELAHFI